MPTVDLADLVGDPEPPADPPRLQLGERVVDLPWPIPAALVAAVGANAWAHQYGTAVDQEREGARLVGVVVDLAGPEMARLPAKPLLAAVIKAYRISPESPASSDTSTNTEPSSSQTGDDSTADA